MEVLKMVTLNLIECAMLDDMPRRAAIVDFGLDSIRHMQIMYRGIRSGVITGEELDEAIGDGEKLSKLFSQKFPTVQPPVIFRTAYDDMRGDGWDDE